MKPDISIVIVNYKVKEYVANLLNSLEKARHEYNLEIFVVDNNSGDDSIDYLRSRYQDINYIENNENVGFGKANNQAIQQARGKYTLIINPDTLVSEDTLSVLVKHMEEHPNCGAAGCKLLNPDGTFAPESRRSVPTIWSAFCKVFGLNNLFPKSKFFGQYYLSWMGEDEPSEVPVLSGAFMFWRTAVLKDLEGFDERFFMYGEDIDLSYRVQKTGYHIDYVPETSIIHYKGESTKKGNLRYIRIFNEALYLFFDKHYSSQYSLFFRILIYLSIYVKAITTFIANNIKKTKSLVSDLVILNLSIIVGFLVRFAWEESNIINPEGVKYLMVNLLGTILFLLSSSFLGLLGRSEKGSISTALKNLTLTYTGIVVVTFFVRGMAFSRLALFLGFIFGTLFFILFKLYQVNKTNSGKFSRGRIRNARVLIVGGADQTQNITNKIHSRPDWSYEVVGYVDSQGEHEGENYLGGLPQLLDLVRAYNVDQVFFALKSISYKQMLKEISNLQKEQVIFKLIPDSMDFILGKSNVEYLEAIPLVEVEFDYSKPLNTFVKRLMDIGLSLPLVFILGIVTLPGLLISNKEFIYFGDIKLYKDVQQHKWKNRLRLLTYVLFGKLSLVGAPLYKTVMEREDPVKKGMTGLVQISEHRISNPEDAESFELYYLQNHSLWMDLDILIKMIFNGPYPLEQLANASFRYKK